MLFSSLTTRQKLFLVLQFSVSYFLSFYWWMGNDNAAQVLQLYPDWSHGGFVLYDGYGTYAGLMYFFMANPGPETFGALSAYAETYIHSARPVFPFLVALVNFLFHNILVSSIVVNFFSSIAAVAMFNLLLRRHYDFTGTSIFLLNVLFLSHVSIISTLARPMADSLAIAILLLCIHFFLEAKAGSTRHWIYLLVAIAIGALTKTVLFLVLFAVPLALIPAVKRNGTSFRAVAVAAGFALLFTATMLLAVRLFLSETAAVQFLFEALRSVVRIPDSPGFFASFFVSGAVFLAIGFQAHPIFIAANKSILESKWSIHAAWILVYIAQRFVFHGFDLYHSRARYPLPLVPGILILAWPGIERFCGPRHTKNAAISFAALNYIVWIALLIRET